MHPEMKKIWRKNWYWVLGIIAFVFLAEGAILFIDIEKGKLLDAALANSKTGIIRGVLAIFILCIAMPVCFYVYTLCLQAFRVRAEADIRGQIFYSVLGRSYPAYLNHKEGKYLSVYTEQLAELENAYFFSYFGLAQIVANYVITLVLAPLLHPALLVIVLFTLIPTLGIPMLLRKKTTLAQQDEIKAKEVNVGKLNELLYGLETIFSYRRRHIYCERFCANADIITDKTIRRQSLQFTGFHSSRLIISLCSSLLMLVSALFLADDHFTAGDYVLSIGLAGKLIGNMSYTSHYLQQLNAVGATIRSIFSVVEEGQAEQKREEERQKTGKTLLGPVQEIRFNDVSFSYDLNRVEKDETSDLLNENAEQTFVISNFDYQVSEPGIHLICGESGSGKSTLISILAAYYQLPSGSVSINGIDVQCISNLNNLITIMRQEPIFFAGSLKENLTMFAPVDDDLLIEEMRAIGLSKFANPDTLHMPLATYSGGEARRMMVLRCILRDSEIMVFDEPLANLDSQSIERIEKRLQEIQGRFVLLISHQKPGFAPDSVLHMI